MDEKNATSAEVLEAVANYLRETFEPTSEVIFSRSYLMDIAVQVVGIISQKTDRLN